MGQYSKFGKILFLALAFLLISSTFAFATTIYVKTDGNDGSDGSTWALAKKTIQAGITTAVADDEVWVAQGTYVERISLKDGVKLCGGYSGVGTTRDIKAYVTIIDGNSSGPVVLCLSGATLATVIDGFTIRNGLRQGYSSGGGVSCSYSAPTISNNTITGNRGWDGAGIYCYSSAPTISGNTITGNVASSGGGGIFCFSCSPTITNNLITGNSATWVGGGIACYYSNSSPIIANNTITGNSAPTGGGIHCDTTCSPTIRNNAIAQNSASSGGGIYCNGSSATVTSNTITSNTALNAGGGVECDNCSPTITNNTITGNTVSGGGGGGIHCWTSSPTIANNIVAFNSPGIYNSSGSPSLRNNDVYGNTTYNYSGVSPGTGDISLDPRFAGLASGNLHIQPDSPCRDAGEDTAVQWGWVDMDGQPRVMGAHVDIGADESDDILWERALRVSPGGNDSNDGWTWALAKRTVQAALDAAASGDQVWVAGGTYFERISLRAGVGLYGGFAGAESSRSQRDRLTNVTILDGSNGGSVVTIPPGATAATVIDGFTMRNGNTSGNGGGVYCSSGSPTITNNIVTQNSASYGGGVYCYSSSATMSGNTITANTASAGAGVYSSWSSLTISRTTINQNTASTSGGGVYCTGTSSPTISNNTLVGNAAPTGGGIACYYYASALITNNTVTGNSSSGNGGGIYSSQSVTNISNNVVAFNSSGVYKTNAGTPVLRNNCVYGNTSYDYSGISAGTGDISLDPLFVDKDNGDYHLQSSSPCVDAGTNTGAPATDIEGCIRPQDGDGNGTAICDIGAYEYPMNLAKAKKDSTDGSAVAFGGVPVTACFPSAGRVYVERGDRSLGIRVDTGKTFAEGEMVNVSGTIQTETATGERYVLPSSSYPASMSATSILRPCAMVNRDVGGEDSGLQKGVLGGFGVNNIGLLVTIWGAVTEFDDPENPSLWFKVDDGSMVNVKVAVPSGVTINKNWQFVFVTGVVSCEKSGDDMLPVIKVRKQADIVPL